MRSPISTTVARSQISWSWKRIGRAASPQAGICCGRNSRLGALMALAENVAFDCPALPS